MEIFIDESGTFVVSTGLSVICSLAIPSKSTGPLRRKITYLTREWPKNNGELKGGQLDSSHLADLVEILYQYGSVLHCVAIDVSKEKWHEVSEHKTKQCTGLTEYLVPDHHPNFVQAVWDLRSRLEKMPNQLYLQCVLLSELVWLTVEDVILYYSQRRPRELSEFKWFVDAKDSKKISNQEIWWRDTLGPLAESRGRRKPVRLLEHPRFDYSYFNKSFYLEKEIWSPDAPAKVEKGFDVKGLVSNHVYFIDSKSDILIQAVDILASFLRRVLSEEITDVSVVRLLGRLQIVRNQSGNLQSIKFVTLSNAKWNENSLAKTVRLMTSQGRKMLLKNI